MKNIFTIAILALVMLGCQKTNTSKSQNDLVINSSGLINNARTFFDNYISTTKAQLTYSSDGNFNRHQVNKSPLWEKAYIIHDKIKGDVVAVPLQYEKPLYFKANFGNGNTLSLDKQSELWIYKDGTGKYKADVRITLPDKTYQEGTSKYFTGYLLEEDWAGNSIATYIYKDDKVSLLKKNPLPLNKSNPVNREGNVCYVVNWYSCDYIVNGVGYNCQLLFSEYIPCEGGDDEEDEGGGGGGSVNGYCNTSEWSSGVTSAADLESISISSETSETRTKNYVWVFAKGTFNPTLRWKSHETGVHVKDNNEWKWQSLTHDAVSREGIVIGGSFKCDLNSATPTVGIYNAIMAIDYTFNWSFVCAGSPVSGSSNHTSAKPFNVND